MNIIDEIYELILRADEVLEGVIHRTPLTYSYSFSKITGNNVYLKLENLQKTGAFKVRGAYFKIHSLMPDVKRKGVVAASSGNHAQGVAYASQELDVKATIVMPETTPPYKVVATKSYGADVILYGRVYDDAYSKALEIARESGAYFIHPFNDKYIIAGQGTIGLEIMRTLDSIDYVLVPIGGGGLISGIGVALKKKLGNRVKVIGVEPVNAPKYYKARMKGTPVKIEPKPSLADGVVTKTVGELTYKIMSEVVDDVVLVDEDSIARAMYLLLERAKLLCEGAGALPLAALLSGIIEPKKKNIVAVISGGNADLTTIYRIILRGLLVEGRISRLKLILEDIPGSLMRVLNVLARYRCNIIDVKHDRLGVSIEPGYASVEVIFEIPERHVIQLVIDDLKKMNVRIES